MNWISQLVLRDSPSANVTARTSAPPIPIAEFSSNKACADGQSKITERVEWCGMKLFFAQSARFELANVRITLPSPGFDRIFNLCRDAWLNQATASIFRSLPNSHRIAFSNPGSSVYRERPRWQKAVRPFRCRYSTLAPSRQRWGVVWPGGCQR